MRDSLPTVIEQLQDLKDRQEMLMRAVTRLVASFDPQAPEEAANLVFDLAIAAGIGSQNEAQARLRAWQQPIHTTIGDRVPQVSGGMRVK